MILKSCGNRVIYSDKKTIPGELIDIENFDKPSGWRYLGFNGDSICFPQSAIIDSTYSQLLRVNISSSTDAPIATYYRHSNVDSTVLIDYARLGLETLLEDEDIEFKGYVFNELYYTDMLSVYAELGYKEGDEDYFVLATYIFKDSTLHDFSFIFKNSDDHDERREQYREYLTSLKVDGYLIFSNAELIKVRHTLELNELSIGL